MKQYPAKNLYYGSVATRYDDKRFASVKGQWLDKREKESVTKALQYVGSDCTILDVPCGTGRITEHLLALGYRVAGGDVSDEMIALAEQRIGDHERLLGFYELDAEEMSLPSKSYDCITSVRFMGHLPQTIKIDVLREMVRVARKYLVVTFYRAGPLRSLKWLVTHRSPMTRGSWYPVRRTDLGELFDACRVTPVGHWQVCPVLSDAVVHLLRVGVE